MSLQTQELEDRLHIIGTYFDLDALLGKDTGHQAIAHYYRKSDIFYRHFLNRGGRAMHMGISEDGLFHKDDFLSQARFVGSLLDRPGMKILEVGAGQLFNTRYLAKAFPNCHFTALDLPGRRFLRNRVPSNVQLMEGDYNDLSVFPEQSFDIVFGIETICHAESKEHVFREISRILKPGGRLVIFDGYDVKPLEEMTTLEQRAAAVTKAAMCVTSKDQYIGDIRRYLEAIFTEVQIAGLSRQIKPTLRRLDRLGCKFFMHPRLIRFAKRFLSSDAIMNSIAGWLFLWTSDGETIHSYNRIVATK